MGEIPIVIWITSSLEVFPHSYQTHFINRLTPDAKPVLLQSEQNFKRLMMYAVCISPFSECVFTSRVTVFCEATELIIWSISSSFSLTISPAAEEEHVASQQRHTALADLLFIGATSSM